MPVDAEQGDRLNIEIPKVQQRWLKHWKVSKPVCVLCRKRLALNWEDENVDAILNAWVWRTRGWNRCSDILFGDYNPAGRLPITFYKLHRPITGLQIIIWKDVPTDIWHKTSLSVRIWSELHVLWLSGCKTVLQQNQKDESVTLTLNIANTGKMDGDEVVQIYIKTRTIGWSIKTLKAFKRVNIQAGDTQKQVWTGAKHSVFQQTQTMEVRPGKISDPVRRFIRRHSTEKYTTDNWVKRNS